MKSTRERMVEILRLSMPILILAIGVLSYNVLASQRQPPESRDTETGAPLVETVPVEVSPDGVKIRVDGQVVPHREINVSAEVSGRITKKYPECRAGRYVKAGTPLLEIDPRTYQLTVQRLQEEVAQAEDSRAELDVEIKNYDALIEILKDDLALKQRELDRVSKLFKRGVVNESELDDYQAKQLTARNSLVSMQNQRRVSEAKKNRLVNSRDLAQTKLEEAQLDLAKAKILAPIDGVIVEETVEEGNYVAAGTSLLAVEDTSAAEVRTTLRMQQISWIWRQNQSLGAVENTQSAAEDYQLPEIPAKIRYELAGTTYEWDGYLWRYEGIGLNEKTRTVPVRVLVPQPRTIKKAGSDSALPLRGPKALLRGMFVEVVMQTELNLPFLRIPISAVQPGNIVWVVRNNRLQRIALKNTNFQDDYLIVAAEDTELELGDQIVITPMLLPMPGMEVQIKKAAPMEKPDKPTGKTTGTTSDPATPSA